MISHFLVAILLVATLSSVGFLLTDRIALRKCTPEDPVQSYHELRGLYGTILNPGLLIPFTISIFSLIGYVFWFAPSAATASYTTELTWVWLVAPIMGFCTMSYYAVTRHYAGLFSDAVSPVKMFVHRMVKLLGYTAAMGIFAILIYYSLRSFVYFAVAIGIVMSLPLAHAAISPRLKSWWSLRSRPIELTDYLIDVEAMTEIGGYDVYVEESLSDADDNAFAQGIGAKEPIITLREKVFEYGSEARKATLYHEISHHEHNDILKQSIVTAVSSGVIYAIGIESGSLIVSALGAEKTVLSVMIGGLLPAFGVICVSYVVSGWVSRRAEYAADNYAANKVSPQAMIDALTEDGDESERSLWRRLSATHPSREARIANLRNDD